MEEALLARVGVDQLDVGRRAAREAQVAQRLVVDREDAAGGAVFGRHVGDGRAVRERQRRHARAEELDKLTDDARLAQDLGHRQHEVGRR
jgi:hypothetical protein